jgi:hypothetical protein
LPSLASSWKASCWASTGISLSDQVLGT